MDLLSSFLVKLAPSSAHGWLALGSEVFAGKSELETANSVYVFRDGVLVSRAKRRSPSSETKASLVGLRLVGFLAEEDRLYALSPRWRPASLGVLFRPSPDAEPDPKAFVVTTATVAFGREPAPSGPRLRRAMSPPSVRTPVPASLTRLFAAKTLF